MKKSILLIAFSSLFFSCKQKQVIAELIKPKSISIMTTSKESSLNTIWIDSVTGHQVEKLVNRQGKIGRAHV